MRYPSSSFSTTTSGARNPSFSIEAMTLPTCASLGLRWCLMTSRRDTGTRLNRKLCFFEGSVKVNPDVSGSALVWRFRSAIGPSYAVDSPSGRSAAYRPVDDRTHRRARRSSAVEPAGERGRTCACACPMRAAGGSRLGFSELAVGVPFPRWALEILRYAVGSQHVRNLALMARTITVDEAHSMGILDEVVLPGDLMDH